MKKQQNKTDKAPEHILPSTYDEILGGVELQGLAVNKIDMVVHNRAAPNEHPEQFAIDIKRSATWVSPEGHANNVAVVILSMELTLRRGEEAAITIHIVYQLDYSTKLPMTDAFFDIFKNGPLLLQAVPYFRRDVHELSHHAAIPPIIVPLIRVGTQKKPKPAKAKGNGS